MTSFRFYLAVTAIAIAANSGTAASKMDLMSRARLRDARFSEEIISRFGEKKVSTKSAPTQSGEMRALIILEEGHCSSELEAEGVEVSAVLGHVALCSMPTEETDRISTLDCVRKLTIDTPRTLMTSNARSATKVDCIHYAKGLPQSYTGKNVICGIYDQGIDPNHINFLDENGETRILSLSHLRLNGAGLPVFSDFERENVHLFTTDDPGTYHGTHTLGIMAGGYKGQLSEGYPEGYDSAEGNPYYGMAPDADLYVACGLTSDYFIANGINKIVNYAVETGRPTVINLSLGGNIGTHDGNSAMGQFLEEAGKECIIVMAAGNEGDVPLHATKKFTQEDNEFKTLLKANFEPETNDYLRYGQVAIYSDNETTFDIQAIVFNRTTGKVAYRIPLQDPGSGTSAYHITSVDYAVSDYDIISQPLSRYFNGYLGIGSTIDSDTGKFYCVIDYYLTNNQDKNKDDIYVPGFIVNGNEGQTARIWCDGTYTEFDSYGEDGWDEGSTDGTISDMATARNVVVVGSYNVDDTMHYIDGTTEPFQPSLGKFPKGEITSFSAYGTVEDGRELPHVCAPGVSLISSTSRYYIEEDENEISTNMMSAKAHQNGTDHWWSQTGGTSMATPVVAGSIALWLEADPTLTADKVIDIINRTAIVDEQVKNSGNPKQWGAGKFDAYAGLEEVIRENRIKSISGDTSPMLLTRCGERIYKVALPGIPFLDIRVYSISGALVTSAKTSSDKYLLDLSSLSPGVYTICANGISREKFMLK